MDGTVSGRIPWTLSPAQGTPGLILRGWRERMGPAAWPAHHGHLLTGRKCEVGACTTSRRGAPGGDTCQGSSVAAETSQHAPDAPGLSVSPLTDAQGPGVAVALSWCPCSLDGCDCPPRPNPYGALGDSRMALPLHLHLGTIWPFPVLTSLCPGWCPLIFSNDNDEG